MTYIDSLDVACRVCDATYTAGETHSCPGYSYYSELSEQALARSRRRILGEPEPGTREPQMPLVRLLNIALSVCFLYAVLGMWALSLLRGVAL